jgi:hypothetical protein
VLTLTALLSLLGLLGDVARAVSAALVCGVLLRQRIQAEQKT